MTVRVNTSGSLSVKGNALVYRGRYDPNIVAAIKAVPGRRYDPKKKEWEVPANYDSVNAVKDFPGVKILPEVYHLVNSRLEKANAVAVAKEIDKPEPIEPMPIKDVEPYGHQIRGYNISLRLFGWEGDRER